MLCNHIAASISLRANAAAGPLAEHAYWPICSSCKTSCVALAWTAMCGMLLHITRSRQNNAGWSSHQERSAQAACRYGHPQAWRQSGPGLRSLRAVEKNVLRTTFRDYVRRSGKPCMRNRSPYLPDKCAGLPETDPRGPRLQCTAELSVPEQLSTRIGRHMSMLDHGASQR